MSLRRREASDGLNLGEHVFLERLRKQVNVEVKRVALMQSKLEWREKDIREREGKVIAVSGRRPTFEEQASSFKYHL